jgi:hypothetical protein
MSLDEHGPAQPSSVGPVLNQYRVGATRAGLALAERPVDERSVGIRASVPKSLVFGTARAGLDGFRMVLVMVLAPTRSGVPVGVHKTEGFGIPSRQKPFSALILWERQQRSFRELSLCLPQAVLNPLSRHRTSRAFQKARGSNPIAPADLHDLRCQVEAFQNHKVLERCRRRYSLANRLPGIAVAQSPDNVDAQANLGRAYATKPRFDLAVVRYEKALEGNPRSADLHSELGEALTNLNRVDAAISQFEQALAISPGLVEARYYLGAALMTKGQGAKALAQWRQALRKEPDNLQVLNDTAWVLATSTDGTLRNGTEAVTLAAHAVHLSS